MKKIFVVNDNQEVQLFFDCFVIDYKKEASMILLSTEEANCIINQNPDVDLVIMDPRGKRCSAKIAMEEGASDVFCSNGFTRSSAKLARSIKDSP